MHEPPYLVEMALAGALQAIDKEPLGKRLACVIETRGLEGMPALTKELPRFALVNGKRDETEGLGGDRGGRATLHQRRKRSVERRMDDAKAIDRGCSTGANHESRAKAIDECTAMVTQVPRGFRLRTRGLDFHPIGTRLEKAKTEFPVEESPRACVVRAPPENVEGD